MKKRKILSLLILTLFIAAITLSGCADSTKTKTPSENKTAQNPVSDSAKLQTIEVVLYFGDDQANYLLPEKRTVKVKNSNPQIIGEAIVKELIKGPQNKNLKATMPAPARLLSFLITAKTAYVNFSEEIRSNHPGGSTGETMTIMSLVNSLTELKDIENVQLMIDGKKIETLVGHWDTSQPISRDADIIQK